MGLANNAGLLPLPVPVVASPGTGVANQAPSDPALDQLIQYFASLWKAYAGDAWNAANPNEAITRNLFKHNPEEEDFVDSALPALYMWRNPEERMLNRGDEFPVSLARFDLLWVMPPAPTTRKGARSPFYNAWSKVIQHGAKGEPDPNWVAVGDVSESGLFWGSSILEKAGLVEMGFIEATTKEVRVPIKDGGERTYPAFGASISAQELTELKVDGYAQAGLDLKLFTADGLRLTEHAIVHTVSLVARIDTVSSVSGRITIT